MKNPRKCQLTTAIYLLEFLLYFHYGQATVTLSLPNEVICGKKAVVRCHFTGTLATGVNRAWRKGATFIMYGGSSIAGTKYSEDSTLAATNNFFDLIIDPFEKVDEDSYTCRNGGSDFNNMTVSCNVCIVEIRCRTLVIICGIFAGITAVMWVICCLLEYKKKECCQKWCCIRLIVLGFFAVTAWIFWGISYWQCVVRCQGSQKAVFIGPIVIGFCAGVAGIIWGIFCCLQHTGIIHCIPPKEKPDFKKYTEEQLKWMDEMIAATKKVDAATRLNESKKKEKDVQKRLKTCKEQCAAEQNKLSKVMNSYEMKIQDCIQRLKDKMNELEAEMPKLEGNTGV